VYGVKESPPKALRHERLQIDIKTILEIFGGIDIKLNPAHILDCFRLGRFKQSQSRPRPILIKLQRIIDANVILANKTSLLFSFLVKPDMSPEDRAIESILLKEHWSLIQSGHNHKQIKISKNHIYLNGHLRGKVVNSVFQRIKNNTQPSSQPMDHQQSSHTHKSATRIIHPNVCSVISSYNNPKLQNSIYMKLKILSLNCCSLRSSGKRAVFQSLVDEHSPDIICGCELHLDGTYCNAEIFPSTYTTFRKDQIEGADAFRKYFRRARVGR